MKSLLVLLLIFAANNAYNQSIVKGHVADEKGEVLVGANVYIENSYDGASTDVNGDFQFTTAQIGVKTLRVEYLGYEPIGKSIELMGHSQQNDFVMKEAFNQLEAVEITAGSFEAGDRKRAIELSSTDVATTAGALGDIVGAINTLPGTSRVGESGRLYVRGGSHEETKTFIDDLLVGTPYYSTAPNVATRGRFNPFLFSGTVFNTGGYSAEYGQALSSVLLLNTTNAKVKDELNLSIIAGLGGDVTGTKSWESGSVTASGTYFNLAPYVAVIDQNMQWDKPMEVGSNEISLKQKTGKSGMLKFYSNINLNGFSMFQNNLDAPGTKVLYEQRNKNYFINTSWKNNINEKWSFFSGISGTRNVDDICIDEKAITNELRVIHAKAGFDHQASEKVNIKFGGEYFINRFQTRATVDTLSTNDILNHDLISGFVEANIYTSVKLVFRAGGRVEYSDRLKKVNASPRLSAAYKLNDESQVSLACGRFYQLPVNADLMTATSIGFEMADHVLINYQRNIRQRILRGEVFYKNYDNLILYGDKNYGTQNMSNAGDGYAYGFDVFFRDAQSIKNGHFWISYSFLNTERRYRNYPVMATPEFASKHNFSVVYKHFSPQLRSMISGDVSYTSPRAYNDPNKEGFNQERMKAFHAINVSWAYLFRDQIIFYAAINNLLGTKNTFGYRYSSAPDDHGVYAKEAVLPGATRFYLLGVFFTFSKDKTRNQLDKIN